MSVFLAARLKAIERHGKNGVRAVVRVARTSPNADNHVALRESLRDAGLWFSDEDWETMVEKSTAGGAFSVDLFVKLFVGDLASRRSNVLQILWERLDRERRGFVDINTFFDAYDVCRHPDVTSARRSAEDVANDFFALFADCSNGIITKEELFALYSGVSLRIERNEDFELLIMRSFSLDRPKAQYSAPAATRNLTHSSTLGKSHPLYQTSAAMCGVDCDKVSTAKPFNRTGIFTKHAPPPIGATTLNTSITKARV